MTFQIYEIAIHADWEAITDVSENLTASVFRSQFVGNYTTVHMS